MILDKSMAVIVFVVVLFLCVSMSASAGFEPIPFVIDRPDVLDLEEPPQVAVALGGGGARALVNVGVLRALEEAGVPVDLVVGTSMGALVAILYGSGMPMAQIEELVTEIDLSSLFHLNVPFTRSILDGQRFNQAIEELVSHKHLEDFPIPTALLSFDLNQGVKYIHTSGTVSEAIQGPYALPGIFPGITIGEYFLLDGGIQELAPSKAAKELGAEVVITTTAFDRLPYDTYDSPIRSWVRLINIIKEDYSLPIVDAYSDAVIAMDVGSHSLMDFHLAEMFIEYGYEQTAAEMHHILEVLDEAGIERRYRDVPRLADVAQAAEDLKRDRLRYSQPVSQPLAYYGRDYSILAPQLFAAQERRFQYGWGFESGPGAVDVLASGLIDSVEAAARWKKLTPELDLAGAAGMRSSRFWAGTGLQYSGQASFAQAGVVWRQEHGVAPFARAWYDGSYLRTEAVAFTPGLDIEGYGAASVKVPLLDGLAAEGTAVYRRGDAVPAPYIYRGMLSEEPNPAAWQWSGELSYDWTFDYTKEILQLIQMTGFELYQFVDGEIRDKHGMAVGAGARFSLRLLGLKESSFDGYAAYDFQQKKPTFRISVDLSF